MFLFSNFGLFDGLGLYEVDVMKLVGFDLSDNSLVVSIRLLFSLRRKFRFNFLIGIC